MKIMQSSKDGDAEIIFSKAERETIMKTGRLYMEATFFKHFTNILMKLVMEANHNFSEKIKKLGTENK